LRACYRKPFTKLLVKAQPITSGFWYLTYCSERYRKVIEPDSARRKVHEDLTKGVAVDNWTARPYQIVGSGTWPDWMAYFNPLLSERALSVLRDDITPHCQLLPWVDESGHQYTLINVLTRIPRRHWHCEVSSQYKSDSYVAADVISLNDIEVPPIFRLEGYEGGKTFVSDALAHRSVQNGLRGAVFVHPTIRESHLGFIPTNFGRRGTGFIRKEDDLHEEKRHDLH
jgi:hypothetical protein